eukprot:3442017-Rhodomonas_salina.1
MRGSEVLTRCVRVLCAVCCAASETSCSRSWACRCMTRRREGKARRARREGGRMMRRCARRRVHEREAGSEERRGEEGEGIARNACCWDHAGMLISDWIELNHSRCWSKRAAQGFAYQSHSDLASGTGDAQAFCGEALVAEVMSCKH